MTAVANVTYYAPDNSTCGLPREDAWQVLREAQHSDMPWPGFLLGQTPASIWWGWSATSQRFTFLVSRYWCADQMMVQKALSAKSLSDAQGATILTGWIKVLNGKVIEDWDNNQLSRCCPCSWSWCQGWSAGCSTRTPLVVSTRRSARRSVATRSPAATPPSLRSCLASCRRAWEEWCWPSCWRLLCPTSRPSSTRRQPSSRWTSTESLGHPLRRRNCSLSDGFSFSFLSPSPSPGSRSFKRCKADNCSSTSRQTSVFQCSVFTSLLQAISAYLSPPIAIVYLMAILSTRINEKVAFYFSTIHNIPGCFLRLDVWSLCGLGQNGNGLLLQGESRVNLRNWPYPLPHRLLFAWRLMTVPGWWPPSTTCTSRQACSWQRGWSPSSSACARTHPGTTTLSEPPSWPATTRESGRMSMRWEEFSLILRLLFSGSVWCGARSFDKHRDKYRAGESPTRSTWRRVQNFQLLSSLPQLDPWGWDGCGGRWEKPEGDGWALAAALHVAAVHLPEGDPLHQPRHHTQPRRLPLCVLLHQPLLSRRTRPVQKWGNQQNEPSILRIIEMEYHRATAHSLNAKIVD